jgi:hypothetical protein
MKMRMRIGVAIAALGLLAGVSRPVQADIVTSDFQGWVNDGGTSNGAFNGNNTFTGNEFGNRFNSWASYDLSALSGPITSATLDIKLVNFPFGDPTAYTIGINDVSTPFAVFAANSSGVAGYTDLGSGNQYGTVTGPDGEFLVTLSAQAVADINSALGGHFMLGFTNLTLNTQDPTGVDLGLYTNGLVNDFPQLILGRSVPEPSSLVLAGLGGLLGLGYRLRVRKARVA